MILFKSANKKFVDKLADYKKARSYREGARWNSASIPVQYFSSNVQNAMLELSNYMPDPLVANKLNVMGVYESPSLRLHHITPEELPDGWHLYPYPSATQFLGDRYLLDERFDGFVVPSCAINTDLAESNHNEVRNCIYANIVLNPERPSVQQIRLMNYCSPIYSNRSFNGPKKKSGKR
ncbi:RES domain-containing protein [Marinobacter sp. LV10R510-11A]|uniref:RES family NAD+ phosphorylase n=1 Tax=Marinobacter sp. LV10R510-11A TaxID=1415568 RepID=UPI000BB745D7|nr:RES domain-containing protein [Marinobacter sp. LV10R510-11A]